MALPSRQGRRKQGKGPQGTLWGRSRNRSDGPAAVPASARHCTRRYSCDTANTGTQQCREGPRGGRAKREFVGESGSSG
jgi:hypothetical protein